MIDILTAIGRNKVGLVRDMVANDLSLIHEISSYGHSTLSLAVEVNNLELVEFLVDKGVNVNQKVTIKSPVSGRLLKGYVPLMFVKSTEMVEFLCGAGADVSVLNDSGQSILFVIGRTYRVDVLECLALQGASISLKEVSVLSEVVSEELDFRKGELSGSDCVGRIQVLEKMLSWCKNINIENNYRDT